MILSRRKAHFYAAVGLSCALPLVFLAALVWRPTVPTVDESTDTLFAAADFGVPSETEATLATETLTIQGIAVQIETVSTAQDDRRLRIQPAQPIQFADVLVYWVAGEMVPEAIADDAILLGQLAGSSQRQFSIPNDIPNQTGQLVFYSRGQATIIAATPWSP